MHTQLIEHGFQGCEKQMFFAVSTQRKCNLHLYLYTVTNQPERNMVHKVIANLHI